MADFKISGKNVITQAGTDEPVLASNVTLGTGIVKPSNIPNATTSTLSCTTDSTITVATADTSSLSLGMAVSGTGIPSGAYIATIPNSTTFTISAAATNSATNTLTFRTGITDSKLNFSGTVDNTTFLRSDKTWAVAGSPSIADNGDATALTISAAEEVTFEKRATIPSIKPKSNQNLTGTYADHEMIMGDKFTLTGDLTINDNLVLASLSGSGQDIIIEDDGNGRTITTAGKVISCTTTNTDATVTTADTSDLRAGTGVTGTGIPSGATIASVTNATTFELSAAATASGTVNLTFDTAVFEAGEFLGTAGLPSLTDLSGTLGSGVTFPPGYMVYIKHLARNGYGNIGDQANWYPTDMAADYEKTLYLAVTGAEHAPYSKLKIDFTFDVRINKATHAFCEYRLVRWQGSTTVSGTLNSLLQGQYGAASTGLPSNFESYDILSGPAVDDIGGLSGTIYYAIQMRNASGSGIYAGTMYFGAHTDSRTQMIIYGII
jgi:hypothetical protein